MKNSQKPKFLTHLFPISITFSLFHLSLPLFFFSLFFLDLDSFPQLFHFLSLITPVISYAGTMRLAILLMLLLMSVATSSPPKRRRRHSDYEESEDGEEDDDDYSDDDVGRPPEAVPPIQMSDEEKSVLWQNPEHPERRQGRYSGGSDDEQTEFVRTEYTDQEYKKLRTYSECWGPVQCSEIPL